MYQNTLRFQTAGRGTLDITAPVAAQVQAGGISAGLCHLFLQHTSASLILCENADPAVRADLEDWMARAVLDGDPRFRHDEEGPDDMSAHIRAILTTSTLTLPICGGRLALGTWQGIYLYEHRTQPHTRSLILTAWGG